MSSKRVFDSTFILKKTAAHNIGNRTLAPTHDCAYFILAAIGLASFAHTESICYKRCDV